MPVHFLDNYSDKNLKEQIVTQDGKTLYGELWVYEQFKSFNTNDFLKDEIWYLKHNYNLSSHPASKRKNEGQIDFILLSKYGILILEVKGGGLRVDENDCYFSFDNSGSYESQNPFIQAKEYVHTLKNYIDASVFVYRAIILPHEAGFNLKGPQLEGYREIFFSKADIDGLGERATQHKFFLFISELNKKAKMRTLKKSFNSLSPENLNKKIIELYPLLTSTEIKRLKSELFPIQSTYGYNPEKIYADIIIKDNYEILNGLRRNKKLLIQGGPGTGKTTLAIKYMAENLIKQQKGIFFCANLLIKSKIEYSIINDYQLDPNYISFRIYNNNLTIENIGEDIDFIIFDEAQEYFDNGLYELIELINSKLSDPKLLVLYDQDQAIVSNIKELSWYTDFFIEMGYAHFNFDTNHRCFQNKSISEISYHILKNDLKTIKSKFEPVITIGDRNDKILELNAIKKIIDDTKFTNSEKIILFQSHIVEEFSKIIHNYFNTHIEELNENNINHKSSKIRYTTPLKYRGLENESIYLFTNDISETTKVQNYVGATRAISNLKIYLWK